VPTEFSILWLQIVLILPVGGVPEADSVISGRHFHEKKKKTSEYFLETQIFSFFRL
jgi:hypothetical protein